MTCVKHLKNSQIYYFSCCKMQSEGELIQYPSSFLLFFVGVQWTLKKLMLVLCKKNVNGIFKISLVDSFISYHVLLLCSPKSISQYIIPVLRYICPGTYSLRLKKPTQEGTPPNTMNLDNCLFLEWREYIWSDMNFTSMHVNHSLTSFNLSFDQ